MVAAAQGLRFGLKRGSKERDMPKQIQTVAVSLSLVALLAAIAIAGSVSDDKPTVESPYTYTLDPDVDKDKYICPDDGWWFTLDTGFDAAKEPGCRPVNVIRRSANPFYDTVCWANECCRYEVRTGPNGWPRVVLICKTDKVKCPTVNAGDPWPTPPPP